MKNLDISKKREFYQLVDSLKQDTPRVWGKMTPQHMIEHLLVMFKASNGTVSLPCLTPPEKMEKVKAYFAKERPFKPDTKSPMLPEAPLDLEFGSLAEAKEVFLENVEKFHLYFEKSQTKATHPLLGDLDYKAWVVFHNQHVSHHFRQFGLVD